jgi:hypothetical protein
MCGYHSRSRRTHLPLKQGKVSSAKKESRSCLALTYEKASFSRHIASAVIYDADLDTITQSAEIALERSELQSGRRSLQAADGLLSRPLFLSDTTEHASQIQGRLRSSILLTLFVGESS